MGPNFKAAEIAKPLPVCGVPIALASATASPPSCEGWSGRSPRIHPSHTRRRDQREIGVIRRRKRRVRRRVLFAAGRKWFVRRRLWICRAGYGTRSVRLRGARNPYPKKQGSAGSGDARRGDALQLEEAHGRLRFAGSGGEIGGLDHGHDGQVFGRGRAALGIGA